MKSVPRCRWYDVWEGVWWCSVLFRICSLRVPVLVQHLSWFRVCLGPFWAFVILWCLDWVCNCMVPLYSWCIASSSSPTLIPLWYAVCLYRYSKVDFSAGFPFETTRDLTLLCLLVGAMCTDGSAGILLQVRQLGCEEESVLASDSVTSTIVVASGSPHVKTAIRSAEAATCMDSTEAVGRQQRKTWRCAFCGSVMSDEVTLHRIRSEPDGDGDSEVDLCSRCCGCDGEGEQPRPELHNNLAPAASDMVRKKPRRTRFLAASFKLGRRVKNVKVKNPDKADLRASRDEDVFADDTVDF